ncbi:MAG TPA: two-component regulator propeller domain-containing protein [Chitinophagaceae bacterium]|nr:two-component regulator propeller domain-containing protein [Chitinophagaceae bacterium]
MYKKKFLLLHAYFFLCLAESNAQQLPFINYTPSDGLVNNQVRNMYQDSKGRLYFMTFGGLSVFDGARFTNYTQAGGLAIDLVNDVLEITPDSIWVATNTTQLNCLVKGKIITVKTKDGFCPVINSFFKSRAGTIYVAADDGLFVWQDRRFRKLSFLYKGKEGGEFVMQIQEAGKFLLIRHNNSLSKNPGVLFLYDPAQEKIIEADTSLLIFHFARHVNGDIWAATGKGIRILREGDLNKGKIIPEMLPDGYSSVRDIPVSLIKFDQLGSLWLSSYEKGVYFIKNAEPAVLYNVNSGLGSIRISYIFQDREGNYWFLPEGKGAQKLVANNLEFFDRPFPNTMVNDLCAEKESDSVWLLSNNTRKLILSVNGRLKAFTIPADLIYMGRMLAKGFSLYLYNQFSVFSLQVSPGDPKVRITHFFKDTSGLKGNGVIDPNGNLIFSSDSAIHVFLTNKTTFTCPIPFYTDQVAIDKRGVVWVATRSSKLLSFSLHPRDPLHYLQSETDLSEQMPAISPRSVAVDDSGRIWIGTRYKGLYCFRYSANRLNMLYHFTSKEGLTDNSINFLNVDRDNNIWASSPAGLDKLEVMTGRVVIKNITQGNNLSLSFNKVMNDRSGTTWALNESGNLLKVYDRPITRLPFTPQLYIAGIRAGTRLFTDADSIHSFSYRQNNLMISVAAPSFYDEKQVKYSYLLAGSGNKEWTDPSRNADLNLINLSPGQYTLKVKASFPGDRYPEQLLSYSFTIQPPWWKTWWFRLVFIVAAITGIFYLIRLYYQRKLEKQLVILEKKQAIEKERTRIASDMHDDLGAGLSTIRFLSEKVKRNSFSDTTRIDAEKIVSNADELVQNMNEIIWAMNEKNDTLEDLVFYTRAYAMGYCEENQLLCEIQIPDDIPRLFLSGEIRRNVFLTVKESLHNIVKHAAASSVTIQFSMDPSLHVIIHDNGSGFSLSKNTKGGNGLRNMQKRIETLGGVFSVMDGKGLTIEIMIPL